MLARSIMPAPPCSTIAQRWALVCCAPAPAVSVVAMITPVSKLRVVPVVFIRVPLLVQIYVSAETRLFVSCIRLMPSRVISQSMMTHARVFTSLFLLAAIAQAASARPRPIPVKVVVVAMFEQGADTGDAPGELQYWVERD